MFQEFLLWTAPGDLFYQDTDANSQVVSIAWFNQGIEQRLGWALLNFSQHQKPLLIISSEAGDSSWYIHEGIKDLGGNKQLEAMKKMLDNRLDAGTLDQ